MAGEDKGQEIENKETEENSIINEQHVGNSKITKKNPVVRALALILVLIYIVLLGIFIYFIVIQSEYILAMLFVLIIYPVVLYLLLWVRKVFKQ